MDNNPTATYDPNNVSITFGDGRTIRFSEAVPVTFTISIKNSSEEMDQMLDDAQTPSLKSEEGEDNV
jgi:hypothetical protein